MNKRVSTILVACLGIAAVLLLGYFALFVPVDNTTTVSAPIPTSSTTDIPVRADAPLQNLNGSWKSASKNGVAMTAIVQDKSITIMMKNEGSTMIYWAGTFDPEAGDGDTVRSDKIEMGQAVLSLATSKNFVIGVNTISFELSVMGNTTMIGMNRA
jgi:hypothetical protein